MQVYLKMAGVFFLLCLGQSTALHHVPALGPDLSKGATWGDDHQRNHCPSIPQEILS